MSLKIIRNKRGDIVRFEQSPRASNATERQPKSRKRKETSPSSVAAPTKEACRPDSCVPVRDSKGVATPKPAPAPAPAPKLRNPTPAPARAPSPPPTKMSSGGIDAVTPHSFSAYAGQGLYGGYEPYFRAKTDAVLSFKASGLPEGVTVDERGVLAGSVAKAGRHVFDVTAVDVGGKEITQQATVNILERPKPGAKIGVLRVHNPGDQRGDAVAMCGYALPMGQSEAIEVKGCPTQVTPLTRATDGSLKTCNLVFQPNMGDSTTKDMEIVAAEGRSLGAPLMPLPVDATLRILPHAWKNGTFQRDKREAPIDIHYKDCEDAPWTATDPCPTQGPLATLSRKKWDGTGKGIAGLSHLHLEWWVMTYGNGDQTVQPYVENRTNNDTPGSLHFDCQILINGKVAADIKNIGAYEKIPNDQALPGYKQDSRMLWTESGREYLDPASDTYNDDDDSGEGKSVPGLSPGCSMVLCPDGTRGLTPFSTTPDSPTGTASQLHVEHDWEAMSRARVLPSYDTRAELTQKMQEIWDRRIKANINAGPGRAPLNCRGDPDNIETGPIAEIEARFLIAPYTKERRDWIVERGADPLVQGMARREPGELQLMDPRDYPKTRCRVESELEQMPAGGPDWVRPIDTKTSKRRRMAFSPSSGAHHEQNALIQWLLTGSYLNQRVAEMVTKYYAMHRHVKYRQGADCLWFYISNARSGTWLARDTLTVSLITPQASKVHEYSMHVLKSNVAALMAWYTNTPGWDSNKRFTRPDCGIDDVRSLGYATFGHFHNASPANWIKQSKWTKLEDGAAEICHPGHESEPIKVVQAYADSAVYLSQGYNGPVYSHIYEAHKDTFPEFFNYMMYTGRFTAGFLSHPAYEFEAGLNSLRYYVRLGRAVPDADYPCGVKITWADSHEDMNELMKEPKDKRGTSLLIKDHKGRNLDTRDCQPGTTFADWKLGSNDRIYPGVWLAANKALESYSFVDPRTPEVTAQAASEAIEKNHPNWTTGVNHKNERVVRYAAMAPWPDIE